MESDGDDDECAPVIHDPAVAARLVAWHAANAVAARTREESRKDGGGGGGGDGGAGHAIDSVGGAGAGTAGTEDAGAGGAAGDVRTFNITPHNVARVAELLRTRPCPVRALLQPHRADGSFTVHAVARDGSGAPHAIAPTWKVQVEVSAEEQLALGASHFGAAIVTADGKRDVPLAPRDSALARLAVALAAVLVRHPVLLGRGSVAVTPLASGVLRVDVLPWERAAVDAALSDALAAAARLAAVDVPDVLADTRILKDDVQPSLWRGGVVPPLVSILFAAAVFMKADKEWAAATPAVRFSLGAHDGTEGVTEGVTLPLLSRAAVPLALCNGLCKEVRRSLQRDLRRAVHPAFRVVSEPL